jgi:hypothetical protein
MNEPKPELPAREHKLARAAFAVATTAIVALSAFGAIHWLVTLHR